MTLRSLRRFSAPAILLGIALACATPAHATVQLSISSSPLPTTNVVGSAVVIPGGTQVSVAGYTGVTGFTVGATGTSLNSLGTAQIDLSTFTINSTGAGTIYLSITDTGYSLNNAASVIASLVNNLTGSFTSGSGTVTNTAWANNSNLAFATTGPLTNTNSTPGTIVTTSGTLSQPFSLTEQLAITFTSAGAFSGDGNAKVTAVPEPSTFLAAAVGLPLAFVAFRSRRRKA